MRYLKSYIVFNESILNNFVLNESKLIVSDNLIQILSSIESDISKKLLSIINTDINTDFNYIDISDIDKLSFIDDKKSSKFPEWSGPRQQISIGRMVRKLIPDIKENDLEFFVNILKSKISSSKGNFKNFKIFKGKDIVNCYQQLEYDKENGIGQLGKSCMNNKPSKFFELYESNPNVISLIVLFDDNNNIIGRSILWETENGFSFMDRIYTYKDSDIELFKLYGDKMGFWYKKDQNTSYMKRDGFSYKFDINNNGKTKNEDIVVKLNNYNFNYYPYLDSLCYFNSKNGKLSNTRFKIDADLLLCNMDGGYKSSDFEWVF